jgi:hypothetical protein
LSVLFCNCQRLCKSAYVIGLTNICTRSNNENKPFRNGALAKEILDIFDRVPTPA